MLALLMSMAIVSLALSSGRKRGIAPVPGRITSRYGRRIGRTSRREEWHAGTDFSSESGSNVKSILPGIVHYVGRDADRQPGFQGYGNCVVVRHPDFGVWVLYAHLASIANDIAVGAQLTSGSDIGVVGSTSNGRFASMPVHLHFEIRTDTSTGRPPFPGQYSQFNVNPEEFLASIGVRYDETGRLI